MPKTKTMIIRNFPVEVYYWLQDKARENQRNGKKPAYANRILIELASQYKASEEKKEGKNENGK